MPRSHPTRIVTASEQEATLSDAQRKTIQAVKGLNIVLCAIGYYDQQANLRRIAGCFFQPVLEYVPKSLFSLFPSPLPPYETRNSPGKGKGLFATRDFHPGELIVVERPLVIIPSMLSSGHGLSPDEVLDEVIGRLTESDRALFYSLGNAKARGASLSKAFGIFSTNAIGIKIMGAPGAEGHAVVNPIISRVNHSCGPNSSWRFDYTTYSMHLQADRYIPKSMEITSSYCDLVSMTRAERLYELEAKYHFTCDCPHCLPLSPESDHRRKTLDDWFKTHLTYNKWIADPDRQPYGLISSSLAALVLVKKEGLECQHVSRHYVDIAKSYGALGEKKKMREWGWKFLLAYKGHEDRKEEHLAKWVDCLRDPPRYFPDWGKAAKKST